MKRYPLAGDLQRQMHAELTGNPTENPYEVHSDSGLEGAFAREEDADGYADELRRIGARNVRVEKKVRTRVLQQHRGNPVTDEWDNYDTDILDGIARAIWVTSWADWVEALSKEERKERGLPVKLSGIVWDKHAPATPESAYEAAKDLYLLINRANGKACGELFQRACQVDGCEWNAENAELFGHYLAMQAMGNGVSWFDDHKEFPLKFPSRGFEAHYDDGGVWWSPQVRSRENPVRGAHLPPGTEVTWEFRPERITTGEPLRPMKRGKGIIVDAENYGVWPPGYTVRVTESADYRPGELIGVATHNVRRIR